MIAMAVGTALAVIALGYVLQPLLRGTGQAACPRCGAGLETDASFCSSCGAPTESRPNNRGG